MKAWRVEAIGDPAGLRLVDVPLPEPAADEYLVKVEAVGLNFLDTLLVEGRYQVRPALPFTPGMEVVGTVVGGPEAGLRVAAATPSGRLGHRRAVGRGAQARAGPGEPASAGDPRLVARRAAAPARGHGLRLRATARGAGRPRAAAHPRQGDPHDVPDVADGTCRIEFACIESMVLPKET